MRSAPLYSVILTLPTLIDSGSARFQVLPAGIRHRDEPTTTCLESTHDESMFVGVLPDGQARAGRPPCVDHLGVGARSAAYPLEQVEDQSFNGFGRRRLHDARCLVPKV